MVRRLVAAAPIGSGDESPWPTAPMIGGKKDGGWHASGQCSHAAVALEPRTARRPMSDAGGRQEGKEKEEEGKKTFGIAGFCFRLNNFISVLFLARPSGRCLMPARINGIVRSSPSVRAKMTQLEGRLGEASLREMKINQSGTGTEGREPGGKMGKEGKRSDGREKGRSMGDSTGRWRLEFPTPTTDKRTARVRWRDGRRDDGAGGAGRPTR